MALRTTASQKQEAEIPRHPLTDELSPLSGGRRWPEATLIHDITQIPGISAVVSLSEERDAEGAPVRANLHLVGRRCQHWAPDAATTGDCRFGCIKRRAARLEAVSA